MSLLRKIVEIFQVQTGQSTETFERLGTAPVCQSTQAEIVEAVEIEVPLPAESASLMSVTEPVLEVPPVVVEYMQPVPVAECVEPAPTHAATCAHAASVVEYMTPAVVDVPVMAQSQTLSVQRVQKTVEVPQIQFIDKLVDSHVNMRSVPEVEHVVLYTCDCAHGASTGTVPC